MSSVFWGVLLALAVKELYDEIYHRLLHKYYEWKHNKELEEFEMFQEWLEDKEEES